MDRPDFVLIGNSFIRRLRDNYVVPENGRKKGRDISESRLHVAQYAAQAADLGHRVTGLYTAANDINLIEHLNKAETTVRNVMPSIVLLHVGSNDLAHVVTVNPMKTLELATLVVDFAEYLHKQLHVECVIINSVVPRNSKNMSCSAEVFRANMAHFNAVIENYCVSSRKQGLIYNHLRGFFNHKINKRDVPLAPEVWTTDGIHCNPEWMAKYKLRVRFAIMDATTRLGQ